MNTLEYLVKLELDKDGYIYNQSMLTAAAEYIELHNESCDIDDEDWWTPKDWVFYTKEYYPEKLVKKIELYDKICSYFIKQRNECEDQTGCLPIYEDYKEFVYCEDYKDTIGEYYDMITMSDIINFLLTYYEREGEVWNI